jgi:hypothetical protein
MTGNGDFGTGSDPHVEVFWVVTPCSVVVGYQRFRAPEGSTDLRNVGNPTHHNQEDLDLNLRRHENLKFRKMVTYL